MRVQRLFFYALVPSAMLFASCNCSGDSASGAPCDLPEDCRDDQMCVDGTCQVVATAPDSSGGNPSSCEVDEDGDGYGQGCARGPDCDDQDATQTGTEVCDGRDNDCDGEADNGVLSACGDCDPFCTRGGIGTGTENPFDPSTDPSQGVGVDPDGALILNSEEINTDFIWIANTEEGSVSRFSTTPDENGDYLEVGRYITGDDRDVSGPGVPTTRSRLQMDPSRTSVNTLGDVYVGNREWRTYGGGSSGVNGSVTRISVLGEDCPDTNGDGEITTSGFGGVAPTTMLPWGEDDCVLWHRDLADSEYDVRQIRAVAAQDVEGPDGELLQYVWIGGYATDRIAKLDGVTGEVLLVTEAPVRPYGFAIDAAGNLWMSTREGRRIGRLDTTMCSETNLAGCDEDICVGEGAGFDDCAKQRIDGTQHTPYGITVDFKQRVWIGGGDIERYDPSAPVGNRWVRVGYGSGGIAIHGIAADAQGWIWGAGQGSGVIRVNADEPAMGEDQSWVAVEGTTGFSNKGMAVDSDGKIWSITRSDRAVVIDPGAGLTEATVDSDVARSIVDPYTYSDMTGLQLRLATNPRGFYRHVLELCEGETAAWGVLRWMAETPAGTRVVFRVVTADTRAELDTLAGTESNWISVAAVPGDDPPAAIGTALDAAGVGSKAFLMVEVVLIADRSSSTEVITPRVESFDVTQSCPPILN